MLRLVITGRVRAGCAGAVLFAAFSCSKSTPSTTSTTTTVPATPGTAPIPQPGRVSGKTSANAIVVLESKTMREYPPPDLAVMDQVSLTFTPPMLFVRTGQPVEFRNSDDTLHNVHVDNSDTREPAFNVAIPTGETYTYTFTKSGFYHVACDIHPAMAADILATSTPFATTADTDGTFAFVDVPPGSYVLRVYSGASRTERSVEIGPGETRIPSGPDEGHGENG